MKKLIWLSSALALAIVASLPIFVHAQVAISELPGLTVSSRTGARLGLRYMHEDSSTTIGTTNVARLNAWSGANEVQTVSMGGTVTGGTFTLTYSGQTTAAIAWNATASAVKTALDALSNIAVGEVGCAGAVRYRRRR